MTAPVASRWRLGWRCLIALLIIAPAWSPAGQVIAGDQPPPPPTLRGPLPTFAPARPAAAQAGLYDQITPPNGSRILVQDAAGDQFDTQAADDFSIGSGANSWQITAVEVAG